MARQEKKIHYIYKTTCLVSNRYYIGMHSTCNLDDGYMGSGKRLRRSIRKHGIENHKKEIIKFFDTRELLIEGEKKAITPDMITDNNCMNLKGGGEGGFISEEQQRHRSQCAAKARKLKFECDSEFRKKMSDTFSNARKLEYETGKRKKGEFFNWTDKKHSEETKQLMSESSKGMGVGNANSQYGTCWVTKEGENKKIKNDEIDKYQQEGWVKGRKMKVYA